MDSIEPTRGSALSGASGRPTASAAVSRRSVLRGAGLLGAGATLATGATRGEPTAAGVQAAGPDETELTAFFDDLVPAQLDEHDIAGATVSVVADGELRFAKGYGYADVEAGEPVRADETLFRIGSVSKAVTGTAVMHGVEQGHVDVDADVGEYLDDVSVPDADGGPITLEHLGTHTAGFEDRIVGLFARDADDVDPLGTELAANQPARVRPPGDLASYSNYGVALAGHALAEAAGTTFPEYVRAHVFEPLGMDRSTFEQPPPDDLADATATGYTARGGEYSEHGFEFVPVSPAGSMSATATDVARFMLAHLQGGRLAGRRVLDPETVAGMHDRRFANHPALAGVGYGFYETRRGDVRVVGHDGSTVAFHSQLALIPERDLGLFVSYNTASAPPARSDLLDAFLAEFAPPGDPDPIDPEGQPARADALEGWYRTTRRSETTFEKVAGAPQVVQVSVGDDGTLVTESVGGETTRWVEIEPLVFRRVDGHERLAFRTNDGGITHLFLGSNPVTGFERLSRREDPVVQTALFVCSLLVVLSGVLGWSAAGLWHRVKRRPPGADLPRAARWAAGLGSACLLGSLVGLLAIVATDPLSVLYGVPGWFPFALALPTVGVLSTLVAVGYAGLAWRDGYWNRRHRVHYTLVVFAGLVLAWLLSYWNLLWTPL